MNLKPYLELSPEVAAALQEGKPVVALESSIISHGMPYPQNVQTAKTVERLIRTEGAVPATIAVLKGKLKVGLSADEIEYLGKKGKTVAKASRRDLPLLLAKGLDGGTTVAATMIIASLAEIGVMATGGIGGVHRGAETTMDISADLEELAQTDVAVVCAGPKAVLDIGLTLEYLETKGVPVVGFGTNELPAFYCRESGFSVDYRVDSPAELATAIKAKRDLGLHGGLLIANPVPKEHAMSKAQADMVIDRAVKAAADNGIKGKELTPFLLALIKEMTGGMSLDTNIELVYNNARLAAKTAVALADMKGEDEDESLDTLRAEIADDTAESIGREIAAFRTEVEGLINQRMAAMPVNPYMNPYVNPYMNPYAAQPQQPQAPYGQPGFPPQQAPFQPNPYAAQPQPQPNPYAAQPQPAPYVNPYKPERPEPQPEPATPDIQTPNNPYAAIPSDRWVNPFSPKNQGKSIRELIPDVDEFIAEQTAPETPAEPELGGDAPIPEEEVSDNVIARTSDEVMAMVEESVAEEIEEAPVEEAAEEPVEKPVAEEAPAEQVAEAPAEEAPVEEEEDESTLTEYVPPVHEKKERKPDNQNKPEMDGEGMTSYDPEFYRKRAEERKQRIAEAAGESKHKEEAKAAEPEYVDCKGPLEYTGEHPWAWKCTRCGQIFQKHEIPHKCIKTD